MFHWLSDDMVRFKIEVGVEEKCNKMAIPTARPAADDAIINTQCSASKYIITACEGEI